MTDLEYYQDEKEHGAYQYVPLSEIIDDMMADSFDDDSYLKNVKRHRLVSRALSAVKTLTRNVAKDVLAFEMTVPDNLCIVVPRDYVDWVRISVVVRNPTDGGFHLKPLNVNTRINTAIGYLQDHKGEVLFDQEGMILTSDSSNAYGHPYKRYKVSDFTGCGNVGYVNSGEVSVWGEFVVDERKGNILFSSDLMDHEVVIEYISDGLQAELKEEDITIHKYLRTPLEDWIYYASIERLRNVPANEKHRALQRYKAVLHNAKVERAGFDLIEIARHL